MPVPVIDMCDVLEGIPPRRAERTPCDAHVPPRGGIPRAIGAWSRIAAVVEAVRVDDDDGALVWKDRL